MSIQHWCRTGAGRKEEIKSFQTKKSYQNRTIIKEVMSKNVHPAPVPDTVSDGCWTGAGGKEEIKSFQTKKSLSKSDH